MRRLLSRESYPWKGFSSYNRGVSTVSAPAPGLSFFALDAEGTMRVFAPSALWSKPLVPGSTIFDVLPFDLSTLISETLREAHHLGQTLSFSHALVGSAAQPSRLLEVLVFPDLAQGAGAGYCLIQHRDDPTEAERFFRTQSDLIEKSPTATMRVRTDGVLEYFNAAAAPLVHGLGIRCGDVMPESVRAAARASQMAEGRSFELELQGRSYRLRWFRVDESEELGTWLVYGYENTDERATERLVQEQFRRLGSVASQLAHDLNNPLSVIIGSAELAHAKLSRTPPAEAAVIVPLIERMLKGALRMSEIIQSMRKPSA